MFILTTIKDLVQITPEDFRKTSAEAIKDAINAKYSDRIIPNIGLAICLYDLLSTSEGLIGHGTGLVNVDAEFRLIVFRPFRGEILQGRIKSSTELGITIDMNFTSEVFVPAQNLPPDTNFDIAEGVFIWDNEGNEMFFDPAEPVLFRVEAEEWFDRKPTVVQKDEKGDIIERRDTSWRIIGSMNQPGLGPMMWWGIGKDEGQPGKDANGSIEENGEMHVDG
ncbi:DNA-directed rna polymerase III 25 kd polypeptide [Westerdykella ornata]|uniref:DNA-directed RNA polymerase subunit n=1 Tax=Westerdykella ornata TaxID=318751 RepID=A0A6A6JMX4_WESOR|nr:DNA-directed rna polymerase III 25 kd polypeptide [Westerdykella ornata]KAF2277575.1 DNA-directed rna polymerase III 25 kd polypeptide [Westerdykella ornata]